MREEGISLFIFLQPEASIGYGYWVCQTLGTVPPKLVMAPDGVGLNEAARRAVAQARDNLQKAAIRETMDASTLNHLGLLCEQEGLLSVARRHLMRYLVISAQGHFH